MNINSLTISWLSYFLRIHSFSGVLNVSGFPWFAYDRYPDVRGLDYFIMIDYDILCLRRFAWLLRVLVFAKPACHCVELSWPITFLCIFNFAKCPARVVCPVLNALKPVINVLYQCQIPTIMWNIQIYTGMTTHLATCAHPHTLIYTAALVTESIQAWTLNLLAWQPYLQGMSFHPRWGIIWSFTSNNCP